MQLFYILWPGVAFAIITNIAMTRSPKSAILFASGDACGGGLLKLLGLLGAGALLQSSVGLLAVLKAVGSLYIVYVVFKIVVATVKNTEIKIGIIKKGGYFVQGFLFAISYIPSILFYMTLFASIDSKVSFLTKLALLVLIVIFNASYHGFVVFALTHNILQKKHYNYVKIVSCCFMVYFAVKTLIGIFTF